MQRYVGFVAHCLYCSTLFLQKIHAVVLQEHKGARGKDALYDTCELWLKQLHQKPFLMLVCPGCIQLATGMRYEIWLSQEVDLEESPLSMCEVWRPSSVSDQEAAPLYITKQDNGTKSDWILLNGIGPSTLVMVRKDATILKRSALPSESTTMDQRQFFSLNADVLALSSSIAWIQQTVESHIQQCCESMEDLAAVGAIIRADYPMYLYWNNTEMILRERELEISSARSLQ